MRKFLEPRCHIEVHLPVELKARLDLYCLDPVRGKPNYGKRSELIQQLLRDYFLKLAETEHEPADHAAAASHAQS